MASLDVSEAKFRNEREVVKEERRMRIENPPFGRLAGIIYDKAFKVHPLPAPDIGGLADLESAAITDVRDFHKTYYVPNNATIALVGDFETDQARALVEQYFGKVPRGPTSTGCSEGAEAPGRGALYGHRALAPLSAVVVSYHITYDGHADAYPLHVLTKILSDGQSSASTGRSCTRAACAHGVRRREAHRGSESLLCGGARAAWPPARRGHGGAAVRARACRKTEGVTAEELDRAKRQWARDYVLGRRRCSRRRCTSRTPW